VKQKRGKVGGVRGVIVAGHHVGNADRIGILLSVRGTRVAEDVEGNLLGLLNVLNDLWRVRPPGLLEFVEVAGLDA
jgi:hypothetical protein